MNEPKDQSQKMSVGEGIDLVVRAEEELVGQAEALYIRLVTQVPGERLSRDEALDRVRSIYANQERYATALEVMVEFGKL